MSRTLALPLLAAALMGCTTSRFACPDDAMRFGSDDPCYTEESYRVQGATYRIGAQPAVELMESSLSGSTATSFTVMYEADSGAKSCNGQVQVRFPHEPAPKEKVEADTLVFGGYRWARYPDPFPDIVCPDSAKPPGALAVLTLESDRKVRDAEGPENGRETRWRFRVEWADRIIEGTVIYSRKMIHHG